MRALVSKLQSFLLLVPHSDFCLLLQLPTTVSQLHHVQRAVPVRWLPLQGSLSHPPSQNNFIAVEEACSDFNFEIINITITTANEPVMLPLSLKVHVWSACIGASHGVPSGGDNPA